MNLKHVLRMLSALALCVLIAGCDTPTRDEIAQESKAFIATAQAQATMADQYEALQWRFPLDCGLNLNKSAYNRECLDAMSEHYAKTEQLATRILHRAIQIGDQDVLQNAAARSAFADPKTGLALVERASKSDASPWVKYHAADILFKGDIVPRDIATASRHLEAAWQHDVVQAAQRLAEIRVFMGDAEDAYRWALRCTLPCRRTTELNSLASKLPGLRVAAIEREVATQMASRSVATESAH